MPSNTCPMTDRPHEYDSGECVDCGREEPPVVERVPEDEEPAPDAWLDMALEDALSGGMYS